MMRRSSPASTLALGVSIGPLWAFVTFVVDDPKHYLIPGFNRKDGFPGNQSSRASEQA